LVLAFGPFASLMAWLFSISLAVFAYRDPPPVPYCATVDRMPRHAALELLLLLAGCVLAPLLAAALLWRTMDTERWMAIGCVLLAIGSGVVLGFLEIATGDRLVQAVRGWPIRPRRSSARRSMLTQIRLRHPANVLAGSPDDPPSDVAGPAEDPLRVPFSARPLPAAYRRFSCRARYSIQ
jgi:hypothetical protein